MNLKTSKGFTIVELLIVIVVIAILAAISIVAYSGIQERARNSSAAELANQFQGKVRAFQALTGNLPVSFTSSQFTGYIAAENGEADISGIVTKVTHDSTTAAGTQPTYPTTGNFSQGTQVIWQTETNATNPQKVWYRTGSNTMAALELR